MKTAIMQLAVTDGENRRQRMERVKKLFDRLELEKQKPDLLIFPELWANGFQDYDRYHAQAEILKGESWSLMSEGARRLNCYVHGGSFVAKEQREDGNFFYYNTSLLFDRQGRVVTKYEKMHLFGFQSKEQKLLTPGRSVSVSQTEFGLTGLVTCYDLRFAEQFRLEEVPEIFLCTAAWPKQRLSHWRLFNQMRAVENQCIVISCNTVGTQAGCTCAGHSMVTDPWGNILAEAGEEEELLWVDVDVSEVSKCRNSFPALADRVEIKEGKRV